MRRVSRLAHLGLYDRKDFPRKNTFAFTCKKLINIKNTQYTYCCFRIVRQSYDLGSHFVPATVIRQIEKQNIAHFLMHSRPFVGVN